MPIKYVLHPGTVVSKNDRQRHNISAEVLARLYGVRMSECLVCPSHNVNTREASVARFLLENRKDLIHLYPRSNGDYFLPKE